MNTQRLDTNAVANAVKTVEGWEARDERTIARRFEFANFRAAFGFMTQVAMLAEKAGHHPDWSNSYNCVDIALSTHDADGVTQKDIDLAKAINAAFS